MNDQHILALYSVKIGQFLNRRSAAIHECHRFGQQNFDIFHTAASENRIEFSVLNRNIKIQCDSIDNHEPGIMPRVPVFRSRVAETDHQF